MVAVAKYLFKSLFSNLTQCYFNEIDGGQANRITKSRALKIELDLDIAFAMVN